MSHPLLNLNLKDKLGRTPFATAMLTRNNKAAQMILDREPTAAEQVRLYIYYGQDGNIMWQALDPYIKALGPQIYAPS